MRLATEGRIGGARARIELKKERFACCAAHEAELELWHEDGVADDAGDGLLKGLVGELRWHTDIAVVEIALVGALSGALSLALLIDSIDDVVKKVLFGGKVLQVT